MHYSYKMHDILLLYTRSIIIIKKKRKIKKEKIFFDIWA